jgi:hypothetical protein
MERDQIPHTADRIILTNGREIVHTHHATKSTWHIVLERVERLGRALTDTEISEFMQSAPVARIEHTDSTSPTEYWRELDEDANTPDVMALPTDAINDVDEELGLNIRKLTPEELEADRLTFEEWLGRTGRGSMQEFIDRAVKKANDRWRRTWYLETGGCPCEQGPECGCRLCPQCGPNGTIARKDAGEIDNEAETLGAQAAHEEAIQTGHPSGDVYLEDMLDDMAPTAQKTTYPDWVGQIEEGMARPGPGQAEDNYVYPMECGHETDSPKPLVTGAIVHCSVHGQTYIAKGEGDGDV